MKLKDKKVELLQSTHTIGAEGFATEHLTPICAPVWAYYRHLSGKEIYAADALNYKEEVLFVIGYRTDVNTGTVVKYGGVMYDVTRVDTFEGRKEDITLCCRRRR